MLLLVASIVIISSFFFASRAFAGVQPPQDPGEPSGETALVNEWMNEWMREERIEADIPWFTQKANKVPRQGTCSVHGARRRPPGLPREWRRRAPSPSGLRSPGRKVNAESLYVPRDQPEKESKREKERKKERHGETKLLRWVRPITLFSKGTFIPWLVHRGKRKMQGHAESTQTLQQFCPYRNQDFFCIPFP